MNPGGGQTSLTVAICTFNPRWDHLERTLAALAAQTLKPEAWELVIVDNKSPSPVAGMLDLSWHPRARIVVETIAGIASARARALREFTTELLVFVDDDNVLAPDYLERCVRIASVFPQMGAFCGQVHGEYEVSPAAELHDYLHLLAIREFDRDSWSNFPLDAGRTPCTAGMCLRRSVAEAHLRTLAARSQTLMVGSVGRSTLRGEDDDICYTAGELGLGVGMFHQLHLTHLIPADRLTLEYLMKLYSGIIYSGLVLHYLRDAKRRPPRRDIIWALNWLRCRLRLKGNILKQFLAHSRAESEAWKTIRAWEQQGAACRPEAAS